MYVGWVCVCVQWRNESWVQERRKAKEEEKKAREAVSVCVGGVYVCR